MAILILTSLIGSKVGHAIYYSNLGPFISNMWTSMSQDTQGHYSSRVGRAQRLLYSYKSSDPELMHSKIQLIATPFPAPPPPVPRRCHVPIQDLYAWGTS